MAVFRDEFTLRILGASCAVPNPDQATSSYLLSAGRTQVLLECGHGAVGKLLKYGHPADLSAVVISHMHPDHCFDLVALRNYVYCNRLPRIPLFLPSNGPQVLHDIARALQLGEHYFDAGFDAQPYEAPQSFSIGDLAFRAVAAVHNTTANALEVSAGPGRTMVFSSDTAAFDGLTRLAAGCQLLLVEMTDPAVPASKPRWHMAPSEVAALIAQALPRRTVLTHYAVEHAHAGLAQVVAAVPATDVRLALEGEAHVIRS